MARIRTRTTAKAKAKATPASTASGSFVNSNNIAIVVLLNGYCILHSMKINQSTEEFTI